MSVPAEAQIPVVKPKTEVIIEDVVMQELNIILLERAGFEVRGESSDELYK